MKKIIATMLAFMTTVTYAAIYVNQNSSGGLEYTDTPTSHSNKVEVPPINSISAPKAAITIPLPAAASTSKSTEEDGEEQTNSVSSSYTTFSIVSPKDGETIQNQAVIPVEMKIEPNMLPGDKIQLMLDNKAVGTPTGTSYQELGIVERGTHSLYAVIMNKQNQPIKQSSTITIQVHRNSTITSPAK